MLASSSSSIAEGPAPIRPLHPVAHHITSNVVQFIDDVLDFTSSSGELGKPNLNDIKSGVVTAPVLYAAEEHPELIDMIQRKFKADGDVSRANELVFASNGIERTRDMAEEHCKLAAQTVCTVAHATPCLKLTADVWKRLGC